MAKSQPEFTPEQIEFLEKHNDNLVIPEPRYVTFWFEKAGIDIGVKTVA